MTDPSGSTGARRRPWLIAAAAAAAIIMVVILAVVAARREVQSLPAPTPLPRSPTSATSITTPSASPSPSPSPTSRSSARKASEATSKALVPSPTVSTTARSGNQKTKPPVPLDEGEEVKPGLTATVEKLEAVAGKAESPGEVGGPAIRFTVRLANGGKQSQPLTTTVVNVYYGDESTPASALSGPGVKPMPNSVGPGAKVSATYVFTVPTDSRDKVLITVDYSVDTSVVAFRGRAPR